MESGMCTERKFVGFRSDTAEMFEGSPLLQWREVKITPLIALHADGTVERISRLEDIVSLPDDSAGVFIWPGQWASDCFRFTGAELRAWIAVDQSRQDRIASLLPKTIQSSVRERLNK